MLFISDFRWSYSFFMMIFFTLHYNYRQTQITRYYFHTMSFLNRRLPFNRLRNEPNHSSYPFQKRLPVFLLRFVDRRSGVFTVHIVLPIFVSRINNSFRWADGCALRSNKRKRKTGIRSLDPWRREAYFTWRIRPPDHVAPLVKR